MTCRCPMCGTKRSGKTNKGKRLYTSHNLGTDEHGFQNSKHKRVFRKNVPIGAQSLTSYVNWGEALS